MLSEDLSYRGVRNSQLGGYGSVAEALFSHPVDEFGVYPCWRSSQLLSILHSPPQPSLHSLSNNIPLQLSHRTDDGEDSTPQWRAGVDVLLIAHKINPQVLELLQRQDQVLSAFSIS